MSTILINLLSEQKIPNVIAVREFNPDRIIALATSKFRSHIPLYERVTGKHHEIVSFDPYRVDHDFQTLAQLINSLPADDEIIVNFTGGTKLMTAAALFCTFQSQRTEGKLKMIYVDSENHRLIIFLPGRPRIQIAEQAIRSDIKLQDYLALDGSCIKSAVTTPSAVELERFELSRFLASNDAPGCFFERTTQSEFFSREGKGGGKTRQQLLPGGKIAKENRLELQWSPHEFSFSSGTRQFHYGHNDGNRYLSGIWLEELVYNLLHQALPDAEVCRNVVIPLNAANRLPDHNDKYELDVVATSGIRTILIECKGGYVSSEQVMKLVNINRQYFGFFGRKVLVAKFPPSPSVKTKCKENGIDLIYGTRIMELPQIAKQWLCTVTP